MPRLLKTIIISLSLFLFSSTLVYANLPTPSPHPLRPDPFDPAVGAPDTDYLTNYCAQRPTAVQTRTFSVIPDTIELRVQGPMTIDATGFITPLLSITDPTISDFDLTFPAQAKRYLADYLEGRAFYELSAEDLNSAQYVKQILAALPQLTPAEQQQIKSADSFDTLSPLLQAKIFSGFMMSRYGVARKLLSFNQQSLLKRAMIRRAQGSITQDELIDIYTFPPASRKINNYPVACWDGQKPVDFQDYANQKNPCGSNQTVWLSDFNKQTWAPLPEDEDFAGDESLYLQAFKDWRQKDNQKWSKIWPYVPMFSREDTIGYIESIPEPNTTTDPQVQPVYHPHLARTYEVAGTLTHLLTPKSTQLQPELYTPEATTWLSSNPWSSDKWWISSGQSVPRNLGPVCDPQDPTQIVVSYGDLAADQTIGLNVDGGPEVIPNPNHDPDCDPETENCTYQHSVKFSPNYLSTDTPFLNQINQFLITGPNALFNLFKPEAEIKKDAPQSWPGVGLSEDLSLTSSETLTYQFHPDSEFAALFQNAQTAKFYYKYLGYIQCQKELLIKRLLPFPLSSNYQYFSSVCEQYYQPSFDLAAALGLGNCDQIPQPFSSELDQLIQQAKQKYPDGAIHHLPASVLKAIYAIEATTAYADPDNYACQYNDAGALGLMQITDSAYRWAVPENQRLEDEKVCSEVSGKMSRCNPVDALEIAARVLLVKVGEWNTQTFTVINQNYQMAGYPNDIYNSSCAYYGTWQPDSKTNNLAARLSSNISLPADGQLSYCEYVCAIAGTCPPYPNRQP